MLQKNRKTIRLKSHDYSQRGSYFLTFNTADRRPLLSHIEDGELTLTAIGRRCESLLADLPSDFENFSVEHFVIMPDHVHMIVDINQSGKKSTREFLRWFKSCSARGFTDNTSSGLWQRGSYDVIIRDELMRQRICDYIRNNPSRWHR